MFATSVFVATVTMSTAVGAAHGGGASMDEGPAQMHYMPARFRSLAGGGWVTISSSDVRKSLMPMPGMGGGGKARMSRR